MISQIGKNVQETNEDWFTLPFIKKENANFDNDSKISFGHSSTNYSENLHFKNTKIKTEIDCDLEMDEKPHDASSSSISSIKTEPEDHIINEHAFAAGNYEIKPEEINFKEESGSFPCCMDSDVSTNTPAGKYYSSHNLSWSLDQYMSAYYNCYPSGLYHDFYSAYGPLEPDSEFDKKEECEVKEYSYCSTESTTKTFKDGGFEVTDRSLGYCRKKGSILYFKKQYGKAPYKCICCTYSTSDKLLATKHFNESHKIHGYIYVCTFCAYATNVKDCLLLHIQHKHKCKMLKCNICHHEETLTDFFTKRHKCKVDNNENMSPNKEKTDDRELKLYSTNFDDEITIEKTELDVEIKQENNDVVPKTNIANTLLGQTNLCTMKYDNENGEVVLDNINVCCQEATLANFSINSHKCKIENIPSDIKKTSDIELDVDGEIKQENEVVPRMNIATMSLDQTNLSIISDDNKNKEEVVLDNPNSISGISKAVPSSAVRLNEAKNSSKKTHKIHGNTYICTFCGYTTKEVNGLMIHMQYKHKCRTLRCSTCHCETTLSEFVGKPHKCKVDNSKNIPSNMEKTSDRESELDSSTFEPLFKDEIRIEKTELDIDNEVKQETNKVVHETNIATVLLNQIKSIISDDNRDEEVVPDDTNSVSNISKPVSSVSAGRFNEVKKYSKKTHKIHGNTYVCTFCGYTTKEVNGLMIHMQYKHKCKTLRCSTCNCETPLSEFAGKPHKCNDNSKNTTSNIEKTSDREFALDDANFEPLFDNEITIENTELDIDNEVKQETNKVAHETNIATMLLHQIKSIISDNNRDEEVVLDDTNSVSNIFKPVSSVSAVRFNEVKKYSKRTHKTHGNTYVCTFCGYTTKEVNGLMVHMQYKHKCKTLRCSTCHCETPLSEFAGKPHKCNVDNSKNIASNIDKTSDRESELDNANFEPVFDDEITIEKTKLDVDNEVKQEINKVVHETNIATKSLDQTNLSIISDDNKNEEVVLDDINSVSNNSKPVSSISTVRFDGAMEISNKMQKIHSNKSKVSEYDLFKFTYDKETKAFTCTQCSFETKDRGRLRIHFEKKHGNKLYKCLICSFEVKHQRVLLNHYTEKHNIREYLTKKVIEKKTLKEKNNEESNENEQNLTAEMVTEQTAEGNDIDANENLSAEGKGTKNRTETSDSNSQSESAIPQFKTEVTKSTVREQNGGRKSSNKMQKVSNNTYICPFCGYTAKEVKSLISHMQHEHKCKTLKCNVLRQEETLTDFVVKSQKCRIENIPSDTEKMSDRELELDSANIEPLFDGEIIEETELDVDSETKQEKNNQTYSSITSDDNKNKGEVVLDDESSVSDISKPVSLVSSVRVNITKKSSKKTHTIRGNTYICTFCGYTTKKVNCLMSHMQYEHKCKTFRCSTCHCETTLSDFVKKCHKCKVDNSKNIASNVGESADRKLKNSANLESNFHDVLDETNVVNVSSSNNVSENDPKNYLYITATKEVQSQVRSSVNDIFKCTYDIETKTLTCTQCSFETKDRGCLRKHFKKKHGNKLHKCLICGLKVKQQRVLSNHYREKHNIREYLTKKDIERKTPKQRNDEESNENEQDLTAETNTEQTTEDNDAESNEDLTADDKGSKNKTETCDSNGQSESEKQQNKIETTKSVNKWEEFKCMDCDFKSHELKQVVSHISEVHNKNDVLNNVKTADVKLRSNLSLNILICPYCGLTINENTSLLEHIRTQHKSKEVLKCSQCNFKTKSEDGLKKHKAYTHELHACPECDYKAKQRVCVRRHFSRYHADKFHKCSECDFKTYDESVLSNHVYLEHDETAVIHKCNNCSYKTDNYFRLKKHRCRNYPEICLYRCVHCEFKSRSKDCLVKHLEKIHNEYIVK